MFAEMGAFTLSMGEYPLVALFVLFSKKRLRVWLGQEGLATMPGFMRISF